MRFASFASSQLPSPTPQPREFTTHLSVMAKKKLKEPVKTQEQSQEQDDTAFPRLSKVDSAHSSPHTGYLALSGSLPPPEHTPSSSLPSLHTTRKVADSHITGTGSAGAGGLSGDGKDEGIAREVAGLNWSRESTDIPGGDIQLFHEQSARIVSSPYDCRFFTPISDVVWGGFSLCVRGH